MFADRLYRITDYVDEKSHPRNYQLFLLLIFTSICLAARFSSANQEQVSVAGIGLPPLCPFRVLTGLDCPACGISRALVLVFHGQLLASYYLHIWGIPLALILLAQIPYRLYRAFGGRALALHPALRTWLVRALYVSLGLPWAAKIAIHFL